MPMKMTAFLFLIAMANCGFSQQNKSNEMIEFVHNEFKIHYPESWKLDTSKAWGSEVIIFSPLENEEDKFSENVNFLIQNLEGQNISLESYKTLTEQQIATLATDGKIIESDLVTSGKEPFFRITYSMTQGIYKLKITSLCFIHHDHAYLITFSAETDHYDHYIATGAQILNFF